MMWSAAHLVKNNQFCDLTKKMTELVYLWIYAYKFKFTLIYTKRIHCISNIKECLDCTTFSQSLILSCGFLDVQPM